MVWSGARGYEVGMDGSQRLTDTSPDVERLQVELFRAMSPGRKLLLVADMWATVRALALAGVRERFPKASEAEIRFRLAEVLVGEELARKAYGGEAGLGKT